MKKIILLVLCILLALPNWAFANKYAEMETVELVDSKDGSTSEYNVVNLLIDGNDVLADVPAILYNLNGKTRTLVPISFITEKIGASIAWDGVKKEVTINHQGNTIVLKIESAKAIVNGKEVELPNGVPAKLMSYQGNSRTMVPVNFITQQLGYEIFWNGDTKTVSINKPRQSITGIRYDDSKTYPELRFKVTGEVAMTNFSVNGKLVGASDSLTLDFHNTALDLKVPLKYDSLIINDMIQEIFDVKIQETETSPKGVRAVVDLGYYRNGDVSYDKTTGEMVVQLINSVKYVDVEEVNGQNAVVIETNESPAFNITNLGDKVYVDVIHTKLQEKDSAMIVGKHGIDSITYEQFDDSSLYDSGTRFTRVTINLDNKTTSDNVFVEQVGSKIVAYVANQINGTFAYSRDLEAATSTFGLDLLDAANINVSYDQAINALLFDIPKSQVKKNLELGDSKKDDGLINKVNVELVGDIYKFKVYLVEKTQYRASSDANSFSILFANNNLKDSKFKNITVVVDAGHGGHDPGALSPNGTKEKDIVLKSSLLLKKKLENAGFKVYMTRERDNYVKLYDRAGIANQINADIFVSVHANAARSTKANGIETLYAPDSSRNNKELAVAIQNEMIKASNAVDRGVVARPELVVIRETKMDAVLVELGFLSNQQEEIKLLSDSYLEKLAQSIVDGIKDFVE